MNTNNGKERRNRSSRAIAAGLLLTGGLVAGGFALAANPANPDTARAAPQIAVSDRPARAEGAFAAGFAPVVKRVTPSVVSVSTVTRPRLTSRGGEMPGGALPDHPMLRRFFGERFGLDDPDRLPWNAPGRRGEGSGVIVSRDGYVLTNDHVVDGADSVKVSLSDGREFTARVVGRDPKSDTAVLKIDAGDLPAIEIADSDKVQVGDLVLAIGNPFGVGQSVTLGMVSAKGRAPLGLDYQDFIQTDAAINPGNSGGALVDVEGRLVGINTAILSRSGGNQGIGFAIPANLAREVMVSLVKHGRVIRGYLGVTIQDLTPRLAEQFRVDGREGALVADVVAGGPASRAGFESGDVIIEFNGRKIADSRHLKLEVAQVAPGEAVAVGIVRDGKPRTLRVTAGELPGEENVVKTRHDAGRYADALRGVAVADLSEVARREFGVPAGVRGALVTAVESGCAAAEAGLKAGDVILEINRQKVKGADDAVRLTAEPKDRVTLVHVWTRDGTRYVVVDESAENGA